jgi:DNA-binding NtrC family response regulator
LLAEHFLRLIGKRGSRALPSLSSLNLKQLQEYHWPGNVRELQNVIERAEITSQGRSLHFSLPDENSNGVSTKRLIADEGPDDGREVVPESVMRRREREHRCGLEKKQLENIRPWGGSPSSRD